MNGILGQLPPGLAGWVAADQMNRQKQAGKMQELQGILSMQGALMQQDALRQKLADQEKIRGLISSSPEFQQNPLLGALAQANPGAALQHLTPKPRNPVVVGPGGSLVGADGKPIYTAPFKPTEPGKTELSKLIEEMNALPEGHPSRKLYQDKITKLTTQTPAVNVNLTPPMPGVDPNTGKPVFFQVPKAGGAPQIVPGVVPQSALKDPDGQTPENAGKVAMAQQAITSVDEFRGRVFTEDGRLKRGVLAAMMTPGAAGMPGNEDARIAYSAIRNAVEAKLRMETGAAATEPEVQRTINRFMPTPFDTKASADFKLGELQKFFSTALGQTKGVRENPRRRASDSQPVVDFGSLK
jgi:hypothetical protein